MAGRDTVYALVRQDVPEVNQAVQLAHACIGAGQSYRGHDCTLVVLSVADEIALLRECNALNSQNIECFLFFEPDFPNGYNSACTRPVSSVERQSLRHLPLWKVGNE